MTSSRKYEKFLNVRTVEKLSEELRKKFFRNSLSDFGMKDKCLGFEFMIFDRKNFLTLLVSAYSMQDKKERS